MKNDIISIIVVSLNTKIDFLKTLASIKKQTYNNYEIIVIDGDSKDGTKKEILNKKNLISKYIIEKDNGIYHAMNKGIKISSGNWIIFMNSGDIFFNKNVLKDFDSEKFTKFDIIYGDTVVKTNEFMYLVTSNRFNNNTLFMPFCHQSVFVKSKILKKRKFSLNYKFSSDFDFFLFCYLNKKRFKRINKIISKVKSGGLADRNRQKVINENIDIISKNGNKRLFYSFYFIKIIQYFKDLIKMIFPKIIQRFILKIKYQKYLMD